MKVEIYEDEAGRLVLSVEPEGVNDTTLLKLFAQQGRDAAVSLIPDGCWLSVTPIRSNP